MLNDNRTDDGSLAGDDAAKAGQQSPETGSGGTSGTDAITKAELDAAVADLKRQLEAQKVDRDKGLSRTNRKLEEMRSEFSPLLERASQLIQSGKSVEQALAQANSEQEEAETMASLRDLARAWKETGTLPGKKPGADAADLVSKYQLDGNDPAVVRLLSENTDPVALAVALGNYKAGLSTRPAPAPAAAPSMPAGAPPKADAEAEYQKRMTEIARTKKGEEKLRAIAATKAWARGQGLDKN